MIEDILTADRLEKEGVVTHFGDDLDNRLSIEALRRHFGLKEIRVDRTPAGKPVPGRINIDVGDETCIYPVTTRDDGTVIIDHHYNNAFNTLNILDMILDIDVPYQALDIADTSIETGVDPLNWRSCLSLARYMSNDQLWDMASRSLLTEALTDDQIHRLGLDEAAKEQCQIVGNAVEKVTAEAIPGTKAVVVKEFVQGGSQVAYSMGYEIYASVSPHQNGVTFAVTAKPGTELPDTLLEWGNDLRQKYGNGVFIKPDGTMIVAGGHKNPDFAVPLSLNEVRQAVEESIKKTADKRMEKVLDELISCSSSISEEQGISVLSIKK